MKELVYEPTFDNEKTLIQCIMAAVEEIQTNPDIFHRTRQSLLRCCVTRHNVNGAVFEHLSRHLVH
ncbi:hypothetical protein C0J52_06796 [Blattella germanica]|nr:hypothetical protein C0J52_06796 [Blattella germanica]